MSKYFKISVGVSISMVAVFLIATGSYMTQVNSNTEKIEENEVKIEEIDKLCTVALTRSKQAVRVSGTAVESNVKTEEMIKAFSQTLSDITTKLAVQNANTRHNAQALKRIEDLLINNKVSLVDTKE